MRDRSTCKPFRFLSVLFLAGAGICTGASIQKDGAAYKVAGWSPVTAPSADWPSIFAVYAGTGDVPPMLGTYTVENGCLTFRPRFPQTPGIPTRAVFHAPGGAEVTAVFAAGRNASAASTRVERVYPSAAALPANQLKFYVYFSAPMARGDAWRHIHLVNEAGTRVELPFLEIDQELWDRENRRLTILFDPGRIKRGVLPREQAGAAIEAGKRYTLAIDRDWLDAAGSPLREAFSKTFHVVPEYRTALDPKAWRIAVPIAGTTRALLVDFPKPMDYALLSRVIQVISARGPVRGQVVIDHDETQWRFTPNELWKAGEYLLQIDQSLEDLAGNHIGRAFDVDTFDPVSKNLERTTVSLPFRIAQQ